MVRPCSTQVLAFWSNTAQNGVVNANTIRIRNTARTLSTAASECRPRARSSCIDTPMPPSRITRPSAMQALITKSNFSGQKDGPMAKHSITSTAVAMPAAATSNPGLPCPPRRANKAVRDTLANESGSSPRVGGTRTYCLRPSQKISVAMNISAPGMPKAIAGPKLRRNSGISSEAKKLPKLIVQ